jgi:PleD family two-component response regulator
VSGSGPRRPRLPRSRIGASAENKTCEKPPLPEAVDGGALVKDAEPQPVSVLLVDSPDETRKRLRAALERVAGLSIIGEAHSHSSGMRMFFERRPDVVVVGVCLNDSSGFDVLVSVRQADSRCPLLLLGEAQDNFVEYVGRLYGANEVCYRDTHFFQLRAALERLLNQRSQPAQVR